MQLGAMLETVLYVDDTDAAEAFYTEVLGLTISSREPGKFVFFRLDAQMLLLFVASETEHQAATVGGALVPPHGAHGPGHAAFRIDAADLAAWRDRLRTHGVAIESEVTWPRGGTSLYFRDPAGNSLELAPAGIWGL